jgi:DNA-binding response OmpR family regulator
MAAKLTEPWHRIGPGPAGPSTRNAPWGLVIEDDPGLQSLIRERLTSVGLPPEVACDGAEAIRVIVCARRKPSLIVLDLGLPKLDGEAVAQEIRRLLGEDVPILVASGSVREPIANVAARIRAQSWIVKPFEIDDFDRQVNRLLPPGLASGAA